jgi:serine-type D-Ala-D-Ala carboxypeptidase/endopeptidase (penicillin-binding protein 4)
VGVQGGVTKSLRLKAALAALALGLASCAGPSAWVGRVAPASGDAAVVPAGGRHAEAVSPSSGVSPALAPPEFDAAAWYAGRAEDPNLHGVMIETLRPGRVVAAHNADKLFNPASLVKLATTLVALRRLGPDYRFKIHAYAAGGLRPDGTLDGDLHFAGSSPAFGDKDANALAEELKRLGVRRVAGAVKVTPDFCFNLSDSPETSAGRLVKALRLEQTPRFEVSGAPSGKLLFVYQSQPLRETLLYMNAHSVNFISERVGNRVGGPRGVERFLETELKIAPEEVTLSTASGLEQNRMTPRAVVAVLRALVAEAGRFGVKAADLLPVASADAGTLRRRFDGTPFEGAVLGKTGTLTSTDGGMSSLAGIIYTEGGEPLVFVILDQSAEVWKYRDMQEQLLTEALDGRVTPALVRVERPGGLLPREDIRVESRGAADRVVEASGESATAE